MSAPLKSLYALVLASVALAAPLISLVDREVNHTAFAANPSLSAAASKPTAQVQAVTGPVAGLIDITVSPCGSNGATSECGFQSPWYPFLGLRPVSCCSFTMSNLEEIDICPDSSVYSKSTRTSTVSSPSCWLPSPCKSRAAIQPPSVVPASRGSCS
jgi:hypothetical protein